MFTKTTIILLGLFVVCEVCTLIVFCYQRTVRKLAMRLNIAQSKLVFCYPKWMLTMYKGTFLKFGIILALFIIEWRCALVSLGIFALFFFLSCVIMVPDGGNLIRIRREVKRCGRGRIGITTYQALMTEIEKGIVATGGDLAKIDAEEQKQTEWGLPFKRQENFEWVDGKTKVKDKVKPQDTIIRTWENAPASIKGAVIVIGLVFGGMLLLVGVTIGEMTPLLALVLLLIFVWLGFWIYQILRGKNWTRVFAIVLVLQIIVYPIISKGGAFDFSSTVGGASIALVIAALLFCPGANKWYVSWPQGWSYWPVLLVIAQIVTVLINQSTLERSNENSIDESTASQETRHKRRPKHADPNINYANAPIQKVQEDAQDGIADAQVNLGLRYATGRRGVGKNEFEAATWFLKAAEQGNADAQNSIAEMYASGSGIVKNYGEAIKWYRKAAEQGHVKAQEQLGLSYFVGGNGVEMDWIEAKKWVRKAAEQGSAESQCVLGRLIKLTGGNDKTEAIKWYRKAAAQGYAPAQANLGYCYEIGEGVTKDEEEAIRWYRKAARQGDWSAQETLREKGLSW